MHAEAHPIRARATPRLGPATGNSARLRPATAEPGGGRAPSPDRAPARLLVLGADRRGSRDLEPARSRAPAGRARAATRRRARPGRDRRGAALLRLGRRHRARGRPHASAEGERARPRRGPRLDHARPAQPAARRAARAPRRRARPAAARRAARRRRWEPPRSSRIARARARCRRRARRCRCPPRAPTCARSPKRCPRSRSTTASCTSRARARIASPTLALRDLHFELTHDALGGAPKVGAAGRFFEARAIAAASTSRPASSAMGPSIDVALTDADLGVLAPVAHVRRGCTSTRRGA